MDLFSGYLIPFLIVLSVLVFVHEYGHYWVARRCGVGIRTFSIGFGPELFGFHDKAGTRWRVSAIPLGGYVQMVGDANAASTPEEEDAIPEEDRDRAFQTKSLGQRAAVVAAGPAANFLFSIVALALLFLISGHPFPGPVVGDVLPEAPAAEAGLAPGDLIVSVDGRTVTRFAELAPLINDRGGDPVTLTVLRDGETFTTELTPEAYQPDPETAPDVTFYRIGVAAAVERMGPAAAVTGAVAESWEIASGTVVAIGEMLIGARGTEDLGGPVRIAQLSGSVASVGIEPLIWFMAVLSVNLGLINLLPIPMLDGGHLLFYAVEGLRGRPLSQRAQEYGFRFGLALVLTLIVFTTWNDLVNIEFFVWLQGLFT